MSAPREFDAETRVRAVRLYGDRLRYHGDSKLAARKQVGALLDINPATLRDWIEHEQRSSKPASAGDDASIEGVHSRGTGRYLAGTLDDQRFRDPCAADGRASPQVRPHP